MARQKFRGSTLLSPVPPAIVTCGTMEENNALTIAWTGIINSTPPKTYISVRPQRHSYEIIKKTGEFVIHLTTAALAKTADYCGVYTGAKVDKFEKCGLTRIPSTEVACPTIAESPLALECRVFDVVPLGTHDMFLADIVAVTADDTLLDGNGKLRLDKADLCAYAHGEYFTLGKKLGAFGFSAVKKRTKKKPSGKK